MNNNVGNLEAFFKPRSVAIIGASAKPNKLGNVVLKQFVKRFKGKIYPVNPRYREVEGLKCYPTVLDVPDEVDLAVIIIPAPAVPSVVRQCVKKGVRGIVIISGGFREIGGEGARLEEEVKRSIEGSNTRIIGPNCLGVIDLHSGVDTFFLPEERMKRPPPGDIAIISQSGALASAMLDWAAWRRIGISKAISYGNKVDVDDVDLLYYLERDKDTKVIAVYIEGLRKGRGKAFIEAARRVSKTKPIILLKGGKTARGAVAAASHTAALAGSYEVFRAALRQAGIIEAEDLGELFDLARALRSQPPARGRRVAIITDAGGPGVMATDALERLGLEVPVLSEELQAKLRERYPSYYVTRNPIDLTGSASDEDYEHALRTVLSSNEVDSALVIALMQPPRLTPGLADIIIREASRHGKPVVSMSFGGGITAEFSKRLEEGGIPVYETPERAVKALWALTYYGKVKGAWNESQ